MTRLEKLQKKFGSMYIDAFLVTDAVNIQYLTGFSLVQGDGLLLITNDNAILITDDRYKLALQDFKNDEVVGLITSDYYGSLNKVCNGMKVTVLGFEKTISYRIYDILDELMIADLVPFDNVIESMRIVKDQDEIKKLKRAAHLLDDGYRFVLEYVHPGVTERQVAVELEYWLKKNGAERSSFPTIVASGPNAAKPHATASRKVIEDGDIVVLDFGYFVNGYTADMTRTFAIGSIDPELRDIYTIVKNANEQTINSAKAGMRGDQLDNVGRSIINEAGYDDEFNHGMGHGIGLSVHELPATYGPATDKVHFRMNEVITVEPGIYVPEIGGVRIEDDILVTHGEPEVLTRSSKELQIINVKKTY